MLVAFPEWDEAVRRHEEKGEYKLLTKQLMKKFGAIPVAINEKILKASTEKLEKIGEDIFELHSIEDLLRYL